MSKASYNKRIILPKVRLSFPAIITPKQYEGKGDPYYSAVLSVPKGSPTDIEITKSIKEGIAHVFAGALFAETGYADFMGDKRTTFYRDGDSAKLSARSDGTMPEEFKGFMTAHPRVAADKPPLLLNGARKEVIRFLPDGSVNPETSIFYAGCYVHVSLDLWIQNSKTTKGIRASLRSVMFCSDGAAFAGGPPPSAKEFESLAMEDDSDPLAEFA